MALMLSQKNGRSAFTLIELLVVIGLMAVLATISVAGYSAASRGMTDRGVIQSTVSALRVAQQTCQIDHVPTRVLFFNQRLTDESNRDDATLCQGTAIGIKQAGRITIPNDSLLIDEFADWHQSYSRQLKDDSGSGPGMRIYRMDVTSKAQNLRQCSSVVKTSVVAHPLEDYMIQAGTTIDQWCDNPSHRRTASANGELKNGNNVVWGFKTLNGGLRAGDWNVGDAYGVEIVRIDLPRSYIFGKTLPTSDGMELVADTYFVPDDLDGKLRPNLKGDTPQISAVRSGTGGSVSPKFVGRIDANMLKDD